MSNCRPIIGAVIGALFAATAQATVVQVQFTGIIQEVKPNTFVSASVSVGDPFTGSYSYDTATPDANGSPELGVYALPAYQMTVNVGGLTFTGLMLYTTHARTAPKRVVKLAA